jgi:K+-transporting ATPase KdpF subunit
MPAAASAFRRPPVNLDYLLGAVLSVLLTVYLVYALLRPARF